MSRSDLGQRRRRAAPPSKVIARYAVEAACVETGASVNAVFAYKTWRAAGFRGGADAGWLVVSRARVYAALALRAIYEDTPHPAIAETVNAQNPRLWFHNVDNQIKSEKMLWFKNDAFMRVIEFIEAQIKEARLKEIAARGVCEGVSDSAGM